MRRDGFGDADDFVAAQIVEQNDVVRPQGSRQRLFDVGAKALAVDGAVEEQGAVMPLQRRPAISVVIRQCPCGTGANNGSPRAPGRGGASFWWSPRADPGTGG